MDVNDWDTRYRAAARGSPNPGKRAPETLVAGIAARVAEAFPHHAPDVPGRGQAPLALDLACGAGANALWLAGQGWVVTAVDRSPAAIDLLHASASQQGLPVTTHIADLEAHEFTIAPGAWNLILMCRYLQRDLFEPAALGLAPGGVLIVIALLADPAHESHMQRFRVQPGELAPYFESLRGWSILHHREGATRDHRVAEIAVRRDDI